MKFPATIRCFCGCIQRRFHASAVYRNKSGRSSISTHFDVVVAGGGIAGCATAMHLSSKGMKVCVVDPRAPLSLTSLYSTECYRDMWGHPAMVELVGRSIDLMEKAAIESNNAFGMTRYGYLFVAGTEQGEKDLRDWVSDLSVESKMEVREHSSLSTYRPNVQSVNPRDFAEQIPSGIDVLSGPLAQQIFPFLSPEMKCVFHGRRCGWVMSQQYGQYLWQKAKEHGAEFHGSGLSKVKVENGKVVSVFAGDREIKCNHLVNCGGPFLSVINDMTSGALPIKVHNEQHCKLIVHDLVQAIPKNTPMTILMDSQRVLFDDIGSEEDIQSYLESEMQHRLSNNDKDGAFIIESILSGPVAGGCHLRSWGEDHMLCLWEWIHKHRQPSYPPPFQLPTPDPLYPEIVIRGLARMIPAMGKFLSHSGKWLKGVDGGFYSQSIDNLPMIGPALGDVNNYWLCGCLSGYGIMTSNAAGELISNYIANEDCGLSPMCLDSVSPRRFQEGAMLSGRKEKAQI